MGRDIDHTDGGVAIFREDVANGQAAATLVAPADLTGASGSYDMELLDELPAGTEFLQIDASENRLTLRALVNPNCEDFVLIPGQHGEL